MGVSDKDDNEPIISVGVHIVSQSYNDIQPLSYKTNIKHLYKSDLNVGRLGLCLLPNIPNE